MVPARMVLFRPDTKMEDPTELYENQPIFLGPNDMSGDLLLCSKCKGNNLIVVGRVSSSFTEILVEGEVTSREDSPEVFESIDQFYCRDCNLYHYAITQQTKDLLDAGDEFRELL